MNRLFIIGSFILLLLAFTGTSLIPKNDTVNTVFEMPLQTISIGSAVINVAIADNQKTRRKGLSGLPSLPLDSGLFFVFRDSGKHGIWMKDMKFPIDIIWLNEQLQVIDIHQNISQDTYPETFRPRIPAKFVLEVDAGFSLKYDVKVGSVLSWRAL
ncbi:MAG TPA: DUF192 domain-containing protein [Candidatus Kaiserbacteria bacterium]|nr:DUF192 domain-containing protein [Candidatus Kaiserbacteria bacterium]